MGEQGHLLCLEFSVLSNPRVIGVQGTHIKLNKNRS